MDEYSKEIEEGIKAVYKASLFVRDVQRVLLEEEVISKEDKSPVTIADFGSQALLIHHLTQYFDYPFISEENSDDLKENANLTLRLLSALSPYLSFPSYPSSSPSSLLFSLIDEGSSKEKREGRKWWTIDPIDGTMGFLRKGQYAVALCLLCDNEPVVGILGCPSLPLSLLDPNSPLGCIQIAIKGGGCYQFQLDDAKDGDIRNAKQIFVSSPPLLPDGNSIDVSKLTLIESFEASHSSHSLTSLLSDHIGAKGEGIKMDSQAKYAVIARGDASYYLRLSSLSYREKIWDHAAGSLIVIEAGGIVTDYSSLPLNFSFGKHLSHNQGVIATSKELYLLVKAAIDAVDPISILKQQQQQQQHQ